MATSNISGCPLPGEEWIAGEAANTPCSLTRDSTRHDRRQREDQPAARVESVEPQPERLARAGVHIDDIKGSGGAAAGPIEAVNNDVAMRPQIGTLAASAELRFDLNCFDVALRSDQLGGNRGVVSRAGADLEHAL